MTDALLELLPAALGGDRREQALFGLTLGVLAVGTLLCLVALRFRRLDVPAVAVAAAGAAGWLLSNAPAEGTTIVEVQPGNGLTSADLVVLPASVLVLLLCVQRLRRGAGGGRRPK